MTPPSVRSAQVFDLDALDKDGSGKVMRDELMPALAKAEAARRKILEEW
eukprot:COSAG03_NODE_4995_length_1369_cov_1.722047_3_plen_49_part_00